MLGRKIQKLMIPDELVLNSATVQGQLTVDGVLTSNTNIDLNGSLTLADNSVIASANDYVAPAELQNYVTSQALSDLNATTSVLYAPMYNPIFAGTVWFPDNTFISSTTSSYVTASNLNNLLTNNYAPKANPSFTGLVTFPDTSTITDYLKSSNASSTYLTQTNAASTYAPKASPTFSGDIVLNGNVTLAQTSANSLTLNDHLILCTGSNFLTPVNGPQGYIVTGTNTTDLTSIPTSTTTPLASITLSYGVWLITGQAAIYNSAGAAASAVMSNRQFGITTSTTALEAKYINRAVGSSTLGIGVAAYENVT
jgi:hypothetical protein